MSNDLNQCNFIGRLGGDPEMRSTAGGDAVANFSLAVGSSWKDKTSGEKKESVTWVPIVVFGRLAEVCAQYLKKGSRIYASGRFQVRKWQTREGQDRYTTEVILNEMQMLDTKKDGDRQPAGTAPASGRQDTGSKPAPSQPQPSSEKDFEDDDIPF